MSPRPSLAAPHNQPAARAKRRITLARALQRVRGRVLFFCFSRPLRNEGLEPSLSTMITIVNDHGSRGYAAITTVLH